MVYTNKITTLKGIGEKKAEIFAQLNIFTLADLLQYYPKQNAYIHLDKLNNLSNLNIGSKNILLLQVVRVQSRISRQRLRYASVVLKDEHNYAELLLFSVQVYSAQKLKPQDKVLVVAKAELKQGKIILTDMTALKQTEDIDSYLGIMPSYRLTAKLTQNTLQAAIRAALQVYTVTATDSLPPCIIKQFALMPLSEAIGNIHFPKDNNKLRAAQARLIFEELFFLQFNMYEQKQAVAKFAATPLIADTYIQKILTALPFTLTGEQEKAWQQIHKDLQQPCSMQRLLQGDVGSGKTILAALALAMGTENKYQSALLAPTEILARQHFEYLVELFAASGIEANIELLVGNVERKKRNRILDGLICGQIDIVLGTHALLQDDVVFNNLALVVIDEQHRFGVKQREQLIAKAKNELPHVLVMSATPIPRTLALALYGNLDVSSILSLPACRKQIKTLLYSQAMRQKIYAGAKRQVAEGRQVYVVCPLIEEEETSAQMIYEELRKNYFAEDEIALLHGRLNSNIKEAVMQEFSCGKLKVLVSTTVIEVGINVPNANLIIIEGAENFGLAQLHQLRGRVGRGEHQSYCVLISTKDSEEDDESTARLKMLLECQDGFSLAQADLQLRGTGEIFGTQQHGLSDLCLADIIRDSELVYKIADIMASLPDNPQLYQEICKLKKHSLVSNRLWQSLN